jgi:hypothetical protein
MTTLANGAPLGSPTFDDLERIAAREGWTFTADDRAQRRRHPPIGLQLVGRRGDDPTVLRAGRTFEQL